MKTYCQSCGALVTYEAGNKPSFCSSCGGRLDSKAKVTKKNRDEERPETEYDEYDEDNEDDSDAHLYVPDNISKLDVEIEGDWKQKGETLGSILPKPPKSEDE